jgi:ornithine cyclodeaminase/alanine dehydrogenase-like protein (mu-crystallin family)
MDVLILSAAEVAELLSPEVAIESQRRAFCQLGRGLAVLPPRLLAGGAAGSAAFCYMARLSADGPAVCKFGSVNPANAGRDLPTVSALITVLDSRTGRPAAIMDGTSVTTLRTSAASAVAAAALASPGAGSLAVLGAGVQAEAHVAAIARVLTLTSVRIWSPRRDRREALAGRLASAGAAGPRAAVTAADTAQQAVSGADLVACCTTSQEPLLQTGWLSPGATVISIGSFAPDRCEVPQDLLTRAGSIVVDEVSAAAEQAGPIVAALSSGALSRDRLIPLGEVLAGLATGRAAAGDIVYYNSVGIGVQDAAAAAAVLEAARARGLGSQARF